MLALFLAATLSAWRSVGPAANTVAADPINPRVVYAGTGTGVFKSEDGGAFWRLVGSRTSCSNVETIAIDQTAPAVVYAGTGENCFDDGLFRSDDAGESWTATEIGHPIAGLKTASGIAGRVYFLYETCQAITTLFFACTGHLMRSDDFANTFEPVFPSLSPSFLGVSSFDIDEENPLRLWASAFGIEQAGVFRSDDGGDSWNEINDMFSGPIAVDPRNSDVLLVSSNGTFRSTDGGLHWVESSPSGLTITQFLFDRDRRGVVYAVVNYHDVFRSLDDGISWAPFDTGLSVLFVFGLSESAVDGRDGQILYAATSSGVFVINLGTSSLVVPVKPPSAGVVRGRE